MDGSRKNRMGAPTTNNGSKIGDVIPVANQPIQTNPSLQRDLENFTECIDWANDLAEILEREIASDQSDLDEMEIRGRASEVLQNLDNSRVRLTRFCGNGTRNQHTPAIFGFTPGEFVVGDLKTKLLEQITIAQDIASRMTDLFAANVDQVDKDKEIRIPKSRELYGKLLFVKNGEIISIVNGKDLEKVTFKPPSPETCLTKAQKALDNMLRELKALKQLSTRSADIQESAFRSNMRARNRMTQIIDHAIDCYTHIAYAIGTDPSAIVVAEPLLTNDPTRKGLTLNEDIKAELSLIERRLLSTLDEMAHFATSNTSLKGLTRHGFTLSTKLTNFDRTKQGLSRDVTVR